MSASAIPESDEVRARLHYERVASRVVIEHEGEQRYKPGAFVGNFCRRCGRSLPWDGVAFEISPGLRGPLVHPVVDFGDPPVRLTKLRPSSRFQVRCHPNGR